MSDTESFENVSLDNTSQESWIYLNSKGAVDDDEDGFFEESCSDLTDLDFDSLSIDSEASSLDSFSQTPVMKSAKVQIPKKIKNRLSSLSSSSISLSPETDEDQVLRRRREHQQLMKKGRRKQRRAMNDAMKSLPPCLLESVSEDSILSVFPEYSTNFDTLFENPDLFRRFSAGYNTMKKKKKKKPMTRPLQ
jgi:hypothetical protein